MTTSRSVAFAVLVLLVSSYSAADMPIGPATEARSVRLEDVELIWSNTYIVACKHGTLEVHVIAEDSSSYWWRVGVTGGGSQTNVVVESVVGPFVTYTVWHEQTGHSSKPPISKTVKVDAAGAVPADIRQLFDEPDVIEALQAEYGPLSDGELGQILAGLSGRWSVLDFHDGWATVSVFDSWGNESARSLALPVPKSRCQWFDEAKQRGTLGLAAQDHRRDAPLDVQALYPPWRGPSLEPMKPYRQLTLIPAYPRQHLQLRFNNSEAVVLGTCSDERRIPLRSIFGDEVWHTDYGWSPDTFEVVDREIVSIVGTLVSYVEVRSSSKRDQSRFSHRYVTVDACTDPERPVPLTEVFAEKEVAQALARSPVVSQFTGNPNAESIRDLSIQGDDCDLLRNLETSWAVMEVKDDRARVRLILSAANWKCGDYAEWFDVELPVAEEWKEAFAKAQLDRLLGKELPSFWR